MRIHHSHPAARFTIIPNATLQDQRLSTTARGVLVDILSRPPGWQTNADKMVEQAHRERPEHAEGRRVMRSAYAELEALGYLVRSKVRQPDGTIRTEFDVYDVPHDASRGTGSGTSVATSDDAHSPSSHRGTAYRPSVGGTSLERPSTENENKDSVRAIASLSPTVPRASPNGEREAIMTRLAKQHSASVEEIHGAWLMASDPAYPRAEEYRNHFRDWFEAWIKKPDEVSQDLANYRDKLRCDAEDEQRREDAHMPRYECTGCGRPFQRGVVAEWCRDCAGQAA